MVEGFPLKQRGWGLEEDTCACISQDPGDTIKDPMNLRFTHLSEGGGRIPAPATTAVSSDGRKERKGYTMEQSMLITSPGGSYKT